MMPLHPDGRLDMDAAIAELRRFLDLFLHSSQINVQYEIHEGSKIAGESGPAAPPNLEVTFHGPDEAVLLERHAELLLSLEHIAGRWLHLEPRLQGTITFDCAGFRAARLAELKLSARIAADRVRETHAPFHFQSMASNERRVLHLELGSATDVRTASEGQGADRHVVIYPITGSAQKK